MPATWLSSRNHHLDTDPNSDVLFSKIWGIWFGPRIGQEINGGNLGRIKSLYQVMAIHRFPAKKKKNLAGYGHFVLIFRAIFIIFTFSCWVTLLPSWKIGGFLSHRAPNYHPSIDGIFHETIQRSRGTMSLAPLVWINGKVQKVAVPAPWSDGVRRVVPTCWSQKAP